ncbi:hypothetical protein PRZ48_008909 [Zasmidium cellare]|uniref:RING-type domain-containing protein n=1 Tax=Zasmidium cellare TaxID=395010 RepID=A0ABR0EGT9_ZASCE|nr:hypothetical protein PRZ48_008909 [Zasmidium cellare]
MATFAQAEWGAVGGIQNARVQAWHNSTPNPNVEQCAEELIRLMYFITDAYKTACEKTLDQYTTARTSSPSGDVANIITRHKEAVNRFQSRMPRIEYLGSVIPNSRRWELVDSKRRFHRAWAMYYEANTIVDILNVRAVRQILLSQPPHEINLVERYWRLRNHRRSEFHRVMVLMVRSGAAYANPYFIQPHYDLWCASKREMAARRLEYLGRVNASLQTYLQDDHPQMVGIVQMEVFVDGLFDDLREGRLEFPEDEEVKDVLQWSGEDLEKLKAKMEPPRPVITEAAEVCGSCKKSFNTPCEIDLCHHVFCFACIVPWIDAREKCPICRSKADTGDLVLLDIKIKKADEDTQNDSGENVRANDETEDLKIEEDEAKVEAMLQNLALEAKPIKELIKLAKARMGGAPKNKGSDNGQG